MMTEFLQKIEMTWGELTDQHIGRNVRWYINGRNGPIRNAFGDPITIGGQIQKDPLSGGFMLKSAAVGTIRYLSPEAEIDVLIPIETLPVEPKTRPTEQKCYSCLYFDAKLSICHIVFPPGIVQDAVAPLTLRHTDPDNSCSFHKEKL